jgi:hypothetical protein
LVCSRESATDGQPAPTGDWRRELEKVRKRADQRRSPWQLSYNLACLAARLRDTDTALSRLESALAHPGSEQLTWEWLGRDPDLASLQQHPRFRALRASLVRTIPEDRNG